MKLIRAFGSGLALASMASANIEDEIANTLCNADLDSFCDNNPFDGCTLMLSLLRDDQDCEKATEEMELAVALAEDARESRSFNFGTGYHKWARRMMKSINGYGCWCYFDGNFREGHGMPVNEVDYFCKTLVDGYRCMIKDDAACDPMSVAYISATGPAIHSQFTFSKQEAIREECINNNGAGCAAQACAVEGYFILNIFEFFLSGGQLDSSFNHADGYDYATACVSTPSTNGLATSSICCGDYPERGFHRVRSDGSDRACCGMHFYLTTGTRQCCDNLNVYDTSILTCCNDTSGRSFIDPANCT